MNLRFKSFWLSILFFALISGSGVWAAQTVRVQSSRATFHQAPNPDSPVLGEVSQGQSVRVSDRPTNGWFKAIVPGTRSIGWVNAADLDVGGFDLPQAPNAPEVWPPENRSRNRNPSPVESDKGFYLEVFADFHRYQGVDTGSVTGESFFAPEFGIEGGPKIAQDWWFALNLSRLNFSRTTPVVYEATSTVATATVFYETGTAPLKWYLGGGVGMAVGSNLTIGAVEAPSFSAPTFLLKAKGVYSFAPTFGLAFEGGYRYLNKTGIPLSATTTVDVNLTSLFVGVGVQFLF